MIGFRVKLGNSIAVLNCFLKLVISPIEMINNTSTFQFKQFALIQSNTQLKVTTEATLFAAWINVKNSNRILDIGSGTGVLSLMLAQKSKADINAVEIQESMADLCFENFKMSPWSERLNIHHNSIQEFNNDEKFDTIVCNPPFFFRHLKGNHSGKNKAIHNESLSFEDLSIAVHKLLTDQGNFYVLLPPVEMSSLIKLLAPHGLVLQSKLQMIHKMGKPVLREAACFSSNKKSSPETHQLIMRNEDESYTEAYRNLLKDYLTIF